MLGRILVERVLLTPEQLDEALDERARTQERLGDVLLRRRWVFEDELARVLALQHSIPYVNLDLIGADGSAVSRLPEEVGRRIGAVPVRVNGSGTVIVAVADPNDAAGVLEVADAVGGSMELVVAEPSAIAATWTRAKETAAGQAAPTQPQRRPHGRRRSGGSRPPRRH